MAFEQKSFPSRRQESCETTAPPPYLPAEQFFDRPDAYESLAPSTQSLSHLYPGQPYQSTFTHSPAESYLSPAGSTSRTSSSSGLNPVNKSGQLLQRPIALPAITKKFDAPFIRAYPPVLMQFQLPEEVFLPIIDRLNQIATANPALTGIGIAGDVVGLVPLATTQIVGTALSATAQISSMAVVKGRTELYLRDLNKSVFGPRGLKIELLKLDALAKLSGMPILNSEGKVDRKASILAPLNDLEHDLMVESFARRLQALEPWIQPLRLYELPEVVRPQNAFSKFAADSQKKSHKKGEEKMLKERAKLHHEYTEKFEKNDKELDEKLRKVDKKEAKARDKGDLKEVAKLEKERAKVLKEGEKERKRINQDRLEDDKEEEALRKAYFLVIRSANPSTSPSRSPRMSPTS